jgi:hypothetical protein
MDLREWLAERFEEHRGAPASGCLSDARLAEQGGKIVAIDILADPERLRRLDLTILDDQRWPTATRRSFSTLLSRPTRGA